MSDVPAPISARHKHPALNHRNFKTTTNNLTTTTTPTITKKTSLRTQTKLREENEYKISENRESVKYFNPKTSKFSNPIRSTTSIIPKPCLGMHIRHGDATQDHRQHTKIDRSLESHVLFSKSMMLSMGIKTIFLATDNSTAISSAPLQFSNFKWFSQKRPILLQDLYRVNNEVSNDTPRSNLLMMLFSF